MGKHFGELAVVRGIVYYKLSPHEQKPFAGAIAGIPNFFVRASASWMYWLPNFVTGYFTYKIIEDIHHENTRKNPRDFLDEVPPEVTD